MQTLPPFASVHPHRARLGLFAAAALAAASPGSAQETERASLDEFAAQLVYTAAFADAAVDLSDSGNLCCFYALPNGGELTLYTRNLVANTTAVLRNGATGYGLAMSGDGSSVVWATLGSVSGFPSFLDPGDTNGTNDIYLFPTDLSAPIIWVSVTASGGAANQPSWDPDVSEDGNLVTYSTYSGSNMTANPSPPGGQQVYLRDIALGETRLLSITPGGEGGDGSSGFPQISDTGRYVAFQSDATDLVPGDTNNWTDIFVWDDLLDTLTLVSRTDLGVQTDSWSVRPSLSADGRFVLYGSTASNLTPESQLGQASLYVLDRDPDGDGDLVNTNGVTTMVSVSSLGVPVYGGFLGGVPHGMRLSDDGTQVLFHRPGHGLEPNPTGFFEVWLHDRTTGQTTNVHVDSFGNPANNSANEAIALAGDGSRAAYHTNASNLDPPDTNGQADVYAHRPCDDSISIYCTAGTSASGCNALISATGTASASAPSGFVVSASDVEGSKDGMLFFGQNGRQANPWGNGTSYQCVVPPVKRGGQLPGSGTNGACDGVISQDLNSRWCPSCPKPAQAPTPGLSLQIQLWYRDPLNTSNQSTSLSDAVEVIPCP